MPAEDLGGHFVLGAHLEVIRGSGVQADLTINPWFYAPAALALDVSNVQINQLAALAFDQSLTKQANSRAALPATRQHSRHTWWNKVTVSWRSALYQQHNIESMFELRRGEASELQQLRPPFFGA